MLVSESITRMRRIIRDVNSKVFTDAIFIRIINEMQMRFCMDTGILESYTVLPVPAVCDKTHLHRWEKDFLSHPSNILYNFMSPYTYTQPWEVSATLGLDAQPNGGYTSTQQWESFYVIIQNRTAHYFPDDLIEAIWAGYDEKPIEFVYRKEVDIKNEAFKSKEGLYPYIYIEDIESNLFYLYPKVTGVYGIDDMNSDFGVVVYDEDDNINPSSTDYGLLTFATNGDVDRDYGAAIYYQDTPDSLYLVYKREPVTVSNDNQILDIPKWCVKYVEFAVMERLLKSESDLFDEDLAKHFKVRYNSSVSLVKRLKIKTKSMRTYKLSEYGSRRSSKRHPDLPSSYPSLWR